MICLGNSKGGQLCLPPGDYPHQRDTYGLATPDTQQVLGPAGCTFIFKNTVDDDGTPFQPNITYTDKDTVVAELIKASLFPNANLRGTIKSKEAFFKTECSEKRLSCLHSEINFLGDIACVGVGHDVLAESMQRKDKSLSLHAGAAVFIMGVTYPHESSTPLTSNVADLAAVPYGQAGSFSDNVTAMWVVDAPESDLSTQIVEEAANSGKST
ncbi:MAG: hypothetical protein M1833_001344 [Piccolia ochrophora]|nr:MAG: hypothetical protein M1833_001344 [Piccolia ochrophora]